MESVLAGPNLGGWGGGTSWKPCQNPAEGSTSIFEKDRAIVDKGERPIQVKLESNPECSVSCMYNMYTGLPGLYLVNAD